MAIVNLGWFDSRHKLSDIAPEQFDLGWPQCLSSRDIATLQRPIPTDRKGVQATFYVFGPVSDLFAAIAETCPVERTDLANGQPVKFHTTQALATWLAAQREAPSKNIQAWFDAVEDGSKVITVAPPDETTEQRDDRWLAQYELEVKTASRGAYVRGAAHFNEEKSKYRKAVVKARTRRAEKYRADMKTVPTKNAATPWGAQFVKSGKKTKDCKA